MEKLGRQLRQAAVGARKFPFLGLLNACFYSVEGDRGAGAQGNRGQEGYGRQEEKGQEAGVPNWREPVEKEKNFALLHNILQ